MGCDICGKSGHTLPLNESLRFSGAEDICDSCRKVADKLLTKFRHMAWVRTKKKLMAMKQTMNRDKEAEVWRKAANVCRAWTCSGESMLADGINMCALKLARIFANNAEHTTQREDR